LVGPVGELVLAAAVAFGAAGGSFNQKPNNGEIELRIRVVLEMEGKAPFIGRRIENAFAQFVVSYSLHGLLIAAVNPFWGTNSRSAAFVSRQVM